MVFCASVKTIRTCPPQTSTGAASAASRSGKTDMLFSNKVIAQLLYQSSVLDLKGNDIAQKFSSMKVNYFLFWHFNFLGLIWEPLPI